MHGRTSGSVAAPTRIGGARRDRTDDLLLAKQALSQLSYGPSRCRRLVRMVGLGRLELPTSRLSSARSNQLSYKPKPSRVVMFGLTGRSCARKFLRAIPRHGLVHEEREMKTAVSCQWT